MYTRLALPTNGNDPHFRELCEQHWYLKGCLLADDEFRMNPNFDRAEIDTYGNGTQDFWRGVIETAGTFRMTGARYRYPHIELKGSHAFLTVFLEFLEEQLGARVLQPWNLTGKPAKFDFDGKLDWQIKGEFIRLNNERARELGRLMYIDRSVGREFQRHTADEMVNWVSRKRRL
jgi:hypothetical protein